MPTRHRVFAGDDVSRIWALATSRATVRAVHQLTGALRDEVRLQAGRLDDAPAWPHPEPRLTAGDLVEGALEYWFLTEPVPEGAGEPGLIPDRDDLVHRGEADGCTLLLGRRDGELVLGLEWEAPDKLGFSIVAAFRS